ncbi:hypothetical protein NR798_47270 [Archangium gephyra]|uniref:hypothetical protein n=1 Tax=Archangium gephyra TaxID=48 RepID=UPI0035D4A71D
MRDPFLCGPDARLERTLRAGRPTMLRISREQLQVFEQLSRQSFVNETIDHLRQFTPVHARSLQPDGLRSIIELGVQRAHRHGFTQRGPVRLYIEVMFILGSDFDSDPQFPWAAAVLDKERADESQLDRARELHRATNSYLDVVAGPSGKHALEALLRAQSGGLNPAFNSLVDVDRQHLEILQILGPEKSSYVGERGLRELIRHGRSMARAHDALTVTDEALIVLLMFGLGHGCLTDPQFPWIATILSEFEAGGDKFVRLRSTAMYFLGKTVKRLSRSSGPQPEPARSGARP